MHGVWVRPARTLTGQETPRNKSLSNIEKIHIVEIITGDVMRMYTGDVRARDNHVIIHTV